MSTENTGHTSCFMDVADLSRIDTLAAQIEQPSTTYNPDPLVMAQAVIADNRARAAMIRKLIPQNARNSF